MSSRGAYEPTAVDRYFFIARNANPTLHFKADCGHINHSKPEWMATATIPRWMAHWMFKCDDCVPDEHEQKLQQAAIAQREEYYRRRKSDA